MEKKEGDTLICSVNNKEAGYLITSIPYDEGFEIHINGENFCGKGKYSIYRRKSAEGKCTIEISYKAEGKTLGFLHSAGYCFFLGTKIRCNKRGE